MADCPVCEGKKTVECPDCKGTGKLGSSPPMECSRCGGAGKKTATIAVEAGKV